MVVDQGDLKLCLVELLPVQLHVVEEHPLVDVDCRALVVPCRELLPGVQPREKLDARDGADRVAVAAVAPAQLPRLDEVHAHLVHLALAHRSLALLPSIMLT